MTLHRRRSLAIVFAAIPLLSSCATLGQIHALKDVDFSIAGISAIRLAGIDLDGIQAFRDLSLSDGAVLADAWRNQDVTLAMEIQVRATNPAENAVDARIVRMDWTLLLEDRETISGVVSEETVIPRGQSTVFPVVVRLNLLSFYEGSARDIFELALSFTGLGGEPKSLELRALPVVETIFGPITYSSPVRIVRGTVGG